MAESFLLMTQSLLMIGESNQYNAMMQDLSTDLTL